MPPQAVFHSNVNRLLLSLFHLKPEVPMKTKLYNVFDWQMLMRGFYRCLSDWWHGRGRSMMFRGISQCESSRFLIVDNIQQRMAGDRKDKSLNSVQSQYWSSSPELLLWTSVTHRLFYFSLNCGGRVGFDALKWTPILPCGSVILYKISNYIFGDVQFCHQVYTL